MVLLLSVRIGSTRCRVHTGLAGLAPGGARRADDRGGVARRHRPFVEARALRCRAATVEALGFDLVVRSFGGAVRTVESGGEGAAGADTELAVDAREVGL